MHSNDHPTPTLLLTLGIAYALLYQEGQVPFSTLLFKQTISYIPLPAIYFFHFPSCFCLSPTLNNPAITLEHQSSDAKPLLALTMHNPTTTVQVWKQNSVWNDFVSSMNEISGTIVLTVLKPWNKYAAHKWSKPSICITIFYIWC